MPKIKNIVILGGGFGGLRAALDLSKRHDELHEYNIMLIDREQHHLFIPLLYEVASAFLSKQEAKKLCLRCGVAIDFSFLQTVSFRRRVRVVNDSVVSINKKTQIVQCKKETIPYEYLIVALGAEAETFGIAGVEEHAFTFRWLDDAVRIHQSIDALLSKKREGKEKRVTVAIVGGGATGVELAGELSKFCENACGCYGLTKEDFHITLVEAGNRLLRALHPRVSVWVRKRLENLGVELWLDTCVKQVKKGSIVIAPRPLREGESQDALLCDFREESERELEADVVIWGAGIRSVDLLKTSEFLLDSKGRLEVQDTMLVKGETNVFAVGDCAALLHPRTNETLPQLAQVAIFEGALAAKNILRSIQKRTLAHYEFPFLAHIIPSGGKYAFGEFGRFHFRGLSMYILRRLVDLKYFLSILPFSHAWKVWWRGWRTYTKND